MGELPVAKKRLGQHWLMDANSLMAMCEAAEVSPNDTVLEIGPGIGTLTKYLIQQARRVVAVELDETLAHALVKQVPSPNLEIVHQDILKFDFSSLETGYKIVANIPYYLTSHLIRVLSETSNPPDVVALLVQKEVAERVTALPGDMSLLSVTAQFYWQVNKGIEVPARLFTPPPKVDSQILILKKRPQPLLDVDEKTFFIIVKAGFSARRKTLINSLAGGLRIGKEQIQIALETAGIDPGLRAQALSLQQWHVLYKALAIKT